MLRDYRQDLIEELRGNPGEAAHYLAAALEDGDALCRLIDSLARAGIKLTVKAA